MLDEVVELSLQGTRQVVFQQDAVLQGLMPPLRCLTAFCLQTARRGFSLVLGMVGRTADMGDLPLVQPFGQIARDDFSARYDLDRIKGVFFRPQHSPAEQSYHEKILVLNTAKGGVATAWMLHKMSAHGLTLKAILFNQANTILAQGAALANIATCRRLEDDDVATLIKTGDQVTG